MSADPLHLPVYTGHRHHEVRARTASIKRLSKRELDAGAAEYPEQPGVDYQRPRTLADCDAAGLGDRVPCPFVSCKHHLAVDVDGRTGSIKSNFPDRDPDEVPHTCSLRVADEGGLTLEDVAAAMNLTRERVRQLELLALAKIRAALGDDAIRALLDAADDRHAAADARMAMLPMVEWTTGPRDYAPPVRAGEGAEECATSANGRIW